VIKIYRVEPTDWYGRASGRLKFFIVEWLSRQPQSIKGGGLLMAKSTKKIYMSDETFSGLMESAEQALAFERGARAGYRVTRIAISGHSRNMPGGDHKSSGNRPGPCPKHGKAADEG
jgi:hypothetical protein